MKHVRVRDLLQHAGSTHLSCPECGDTWSATAGDYFMAPLDTVMRCQNDNTLLRLTRTLTREVEV